MLIGLTGRAGSGKDTAYGFISEWAEAQGRPVRRDAFADRLKYSAAQAVGYDGDKAECIAICNQLKQPGWEVAVVEPNGTTHSITGRQYLQYYGVEAHREVFGQDFWINAVLDSYDLFDLGIFVVTDVRFPNEAQAIKAHGGLIWEISRPGHTIDEIAHSSEQSLPADLIDVVIVNAAGLKEFRAQVHCVIPEPPA